MFTLVASPAMAQQRPNLANWALAEKFETDNLRDVVFSTTANARFINETDSLWYNWRDPKGAAFWLVLPQSRTKQPLFDHPAIAAQLSSLHRKPYEAHDLPFTSVEFDSVGRTFHFDVDSTRYRWTLATSQLTSLGPTPRDTTRAAGGGRGGRGGRGGGFGGGQNDDFRNFSPDSTAFAFARDHNLFVVEVATGDTIQLSTDGEEYFSFGARDTAQTRQQQEDDDEDGQTTQQNRRSRDPRVRARVDWSPDSRAFSATRSDSREVDELYLVNVLADPRPELVSYKYAMPGEENVAQMELFAYVRGGTELIEVPVDRWQDQRLFDVHWPVDGDRLRLVRRDRLQRNLELIEVTIPSLETRVLLTESVENAYLERENVRYVKAGGDFVWWSERNGWGHYYLYNHDGTLKHAITSGNWRASGIAAIDSTSRVLFFNGFGREPDENVYYRHLYRTSIDNPSIALLDPGDADHRSQLSPSRRFVVDNYSRIDMPGRSVLRDNAGREILELGLTDVTRLTELGWQAPERFVVKAADGVTDIYGHMWKPFDFDSTKSYPIIAHVYPGPQTESVTTTFSPTAVQQRLAQLGFIVIHIGNRGGSPLRSNAYHSYGYFNLRDYGLADKKAGIEQLGARYPWIDTDRVGIYGHSGGGFMTAAALLLPPYNDFFKVGVSSAGNHDNNVYNQNWSEQHHGLREASDTTRRAVADTENGTNDGDASNGQQDQAAERIKFEIRVPANAELAENLKGRLLLVHGDMDNNVHPAGTIRLAEALIKADKRFDFMIMPGKAHGFGDMQGYFTKMMFEYFAEHLLGDYYRADAAMR
jgi:dipeptidyl aminopeptidase/acylaminoacyl peptidase